MEKLKFKVIKSFSELYPCIMVIDDFHDFESRAVNDDNYMYATVFRNDANKETLCDVNDCYILNNIDMLSNDQVITPTMQDYTMMSEILRARGYRFNRKTGEVINLKKINDSIWNN